MTRTHRRTGFTLVELMVAMSIAIILAGMTVGLVYSTGAATSQKVVGAADKVSGWLMVAKNRAVRDGNAQGVRFFINGNTITEAQYIEKPPKPLTPNPAMVPDGARIAFVYSTDTSTPPNITARRVYYVQGSHTPPPPSPSDLFDSTPPLIQTTAGTDYLLLSEFQSAYRIIGMGSTITITVGGKTETARELTLAEYPDLAAAHTASGGSSVTHVTYGFAFQQSPRPVFGEQTLQIGENTCIDYQQPPSLPPPPSTVTTIGVPFTVPPSPPPLYFDILFTPSGQVITTASSSIIALWVRDPTKTWNPHDFPNAGEQVLVVIYPKTGSISTCLVNPNPADTHKFAYEGINAGL
ncbi:MAG: type II secretion system GspH family protein [Bacteroidales bacterium]|nr:type II secretion system GspH family protein [Bacteroidales bacterium]